MEFDHDGAAVPAKFPALFDRVILNAQQIIDANDEVVPAAMLLASVMRLSRRLQVAVPPNAEALLGAMLERVGPRIRALIEMEGALYPTFEQVVALAKQMEEARFVEDVGYDIHTLVIVARRLLSPRIVNQQAAIYAIEILTDQAVMLPGYARDNGNGRLIGSATGPATAASDLSQQDLAVVTLGIANGHLVRVVAAEGTLLSPVVEPPDVFSPSCLTTWAQTYPYGYTEAREFNIFYTSTQRIGVSELPDRAVVIASTDLQGLPPNLLRVGRELAGQNRRLAAAPSLAWLSAARDNVFSGDGRINAWIPDAKPEEGSATLAIIAERLRESFTLHGVSLTNGPKPPDGLAGSDLMIIAAHGGVAEGKRYFRVVQDDVNLCISSSALSGSLSDIGTVILFVCSGGRVDKHPGASTTVGMVKQLLNNGCRAVIAPPWPIETSVPPYWLPAFLGSWAAGAPVIDACFEANATVRSKLGDNPAKCLAMTVYGDPLSSNSNTHHDRVKPLG